MEPPIAGGASGRLRGARVRWDHAFHSVTYAGRFHILGSASESSRYQGVTIMITSRYGRDVFPVDRLRS